MIKVIYGLMFAVALYFASGIYSAANNMAEVMNKHHTELQATLNKVAK